MKVGVWSLVKKTLTERNGWRKMRPIYGGSYTKVLRGVLLGSKQMSI
jgi:hypothetical protein